MPNADKRGRDATGMRRGIGWLGMEGLVAAGAGVDAGAGVVGFGVVPFAFAVAD